MGWIPRRTTGGPPSAPFGDPERVAAVEAVLARLRPHFKADGGDMRLVRVDEFGFVEVSLHGACDGCMASTLTLRGALEPELRRELPWFEGLRVAA